MNSKIHSIPIHKEKLHRKSPHVVAVQKEDQRLVFVPHDKIQRPRISPSCDIPMVSQRVITEHQFTRPIPVFECVEDTEPITIPLIDLVARDQQMITQHHIDIEKDIASAFERFHSGAKKNQARIKEGIVHQKECRGAQLPPPATAHTYVLKTTIMFAMAAFMVIAPFYTAKFVANAQYTKETLAGISRKINTSLKKAESNIVAGDTENASADLKNVEVNFTHAIHLLESFERDTTFMASAIPPVRNSIKAAHALSESGLLITQSVHSLKNELSQNKPNINQFDQLGKALSASTSKLSLAQTYINSVNPSVLPNDIRTLFQTLKQELNTLVPSLKTASRTTNILNSLLVSQPKQTFLVLFQNNHEIRATGGFWGSFGLVTIKNGAIESFEIPGGGTYDLQGQLDRHLRPPAPMQLVKAEWQFQDANWFADFPTSAEMAMWFLEHAKYGTPDGVIAITPNVLEHLMDITGPIDLPSYEKKLTSENITFELQKSVELEYDKTENKPKAIIGDVANIVLERIQQLDPAQKVAVLSIIHDSLNTKNILLYHKNAQLQKEIVSAGWSGAVNNSWQDDYLMVVNHNIAGQKTDEKIVQDIIKQTTIHENGTMTSELTIRRTHTGAKGELFTGVRNVNYMRVMVPSGSELIHAEGFTYPNESYFKVPETFETHELLTKNEQTKTIHSASGTHITLESGKTTFGNWTQTDPGETTVVKLTYRLPLIIANPQAQSLATAFAEHPSSYTLLAQTQPGAENTTFTHTLTIPSSWRVINSTDENQDLVESIPLTTDRVFGAVLSQTP